MENYGTLLVKPHQIASVFYCVSRMSFIEMLLGKSEWVFECSTR